MSIKENQTVCICDPLDEQALQHYNNEDEEAKGYEYVEDALKIACYYHFNG